MTDDRSLTRVKETTISFGQILIGLGLATLPAGELLFETINQIISHGRSYYAQKANDRIELFHRSLFEKIDTDQVSEFLKKEFSQDEYYALLSHVVNDEEIQKADIYSKLFYYITINLIPSEIRKHLIKMFRNLSMIDFDNIKRYYIHSKFEFEDVGTIHQQLRELSNRKDPINKFSIQNLVAQGLLDDKDGTKPHWPTPLMIQIAEWFIPNDQLKPDAIGRKTMIPVDVIIFCDTSIDISKSGQKVQEILKECNLSSRIVGINQYEELQKKATYFVVIFKNVISNDLKNYINASDKAKRKYIQLNICEQKPKVYTRHAGCEYPIDIASDDYGEFIITAKNLKKVGGNSQPL